ncbi:hypothetical protein BaRGS_00001198 [Batillaria attramentaria]|uniref:Uncharacterized protein n=1 Tax=Batillaria attramentaria TaxID=370345 RepID=A0ABD0M685_9CAEN
MTPHCAPTALGICRAGTEDGFALAVLLMPDPLVSGETGKEKELLKVAARSASLRSEVFKVRHTRSRPTCRGQLGAHPDKIEACAQNARGPWGLDGSTFPCPVAVLGGEDPTVDRTYTAV